MSTSTHIFKTIKGHNLALNLEIPENFDKENGIALVHFHGGFLVWGDKTTFAPAWIINACQKRGWAYITPDYRLLPESTGLEALEDAVDALNWVSNNVAKRVITAGSSAGGYLALAAGANPQSPPLLAILSVYGMLDLTSSRYVAPGTPLPGRSVDAAPVIQIIETLSNGNQSPISGYAFPVNPATDPRNRIISTFHQEALYLDVMTREKGLAERVRKEGIEAIPTQYRELFPAAFGLTKNLPPVALLHGEADSLVAVENSVSVAAKLENLGVKVLLQTYDKGDHGFDVRGIPSDVDIDKQEVGEPLSFAAMRNVIQFLDAAAI